MKGTGASPVLPNRHRDDDAFGRAADRLFPADCVRAAIEEIRSWPGYEPTPLVELPAASGASGRHTATGAATAALRAAGRVLVKLERERFGLGSFKVLGGACAVRHHAAGGADGTDAPAGYVCGSAGNHGLAVAWGARGVQRRATVFVPGTTSEARIARLRGQGADVRVVSGDYEEALRCAEIFASESGGVLVSDSNEREDGTTAPVLWGYALIVDEIERAGIRPTHVFVPAGVGSLAAAVVAACRDVFSPVSPRIVVVEPAGAACVFESLRTGRRARLPEPPRTRLAPLACRIPSADAWPLLSAGVEAAITVTDEEIELAATLLGADGPAEPENCGATALAGVVAAASDATARGVLGLGAGATVVALITE